jgi:threonine dehydrogenase-like Zn-dependent dehydrogenase
VAADYSARRRELALAMGADVVVDPGIDAPFSSWREAAVWRDSSRAPKLPPWVPGPPLRPAVIFECVGVPGVIEQIMVGAPSGARIVVVGVCMQRDEFAATLRHIAEGELPVAPLITGTVGVEGVSAAFEALASPDTHAKILVEPWHA